MKKTMGMGVAEAARATGYTMKYLYDLLQSGRLAGHKKRNRWSIPCESVQRLLTNRIRGSARVQSANGANTGRQVGHRTEDSKAKTVGIEPVNSNVSG